MTNNYNMLNVRERNLSKNEKQSHTLPIAKETRPEKYQIFKRL